MRTGYDVCQNIAESIRLEVELLMILEVDNRGTKDIPKNVSSSGRIKHIEIGISWLGELQERGILDVRWIKGEDNE